MHYVRNQFLNVLCTAFSVYQVTGVSSITKAVWLELKGNARRSR